MDVPLKMDKEIIRSKLVRLNAHLTRIEDRRPEPLSKILTDLDVQDILSHNLEKAVQFCIDIASHICAAHGRVPQTSSEAFLTLSELGIIDGELAAKMVLAVGFRNVLVHEYAETNWAIVMKVVVDGIEDLKSFGKSIASLVSEPPPPGSRK